MLEPLKTLSTAEARAGADEFVYNLTEELRKSIMLDVRYALRDIASNAVRARDFPLLTLLGQTVERDLNRIRFPAEVLAKLLRELESVRAKLPAKGPLRDLLESAGQRAAADPAGTAKGPNTVSPAAAPSSASEVAQNLKTAASQVEVTYVTTMELGDNALAGYLKYCLGVGEYAKIIETLLPRAEKAPRVWVWSLLTTAMRLADHPEFRVTAERFHTWLETAHPETINDLTAKDERRRFKFEAVAAIEVRELGGK